MIPLAEVEHALVCGFGIGKSLYRGYENNCCGNASENGIEREASEENAAGFEVLLYGEA